jgi:hypothetical protein
MEPPLQIQLFVSTPHDPPRQIETSVTDRIAVLDFHFKNRHFTYVHRGQILDTSCTFQFYGIRSRDAIVALSPDSVQRSVWSDQEQLALLDPNYRDAFMRASDRSLARFETRPSLYQKMVRRMLQLQEQLDVRRIGTGEVVIPEPAVSISDQPLPRIW